MTALTESAINFLAHEDTPVLPYKGLLRYPLWDSLGKAEFSNGTLYALPLLFEKIGFRKFQYPLTTTVEQAGRYVDQPSPDGIRLFAKAFFVMEPHHPDQKIVCQDRGLKDS